MQDKRSVTRDSEDTQEVHVGVSTLPNPILQPQTSVDTFVDEYDGVKESNNQLNYK